MNIPKFKSKNIASVLKIDVLPAYALLSYNPNDDTSIKQSGILMRSGYDWSNIYCTEGSMGLQVTETQDVNGTLYSNAIVGFIPGEDMEIQKALGLFKDRQVIARVKTANGYTRFVGSPEQPLDMTTVFDTLTSPDGRAGHALKISGVTDFSPYYLVL